MAGGLVGLNYLQGWYFFALNIDTPNRLADLPKREQIGRAVLASLQVLPKQTAKN